eukprot:gene26098-11808_t
MYTPDPKGIPVSCPNWTTEAIELLSAALKVNTEVFLDNCFVPPPRPPALLEVSGQPAFPPLFPLSPSSPPPGDSGDEIPIAIIGGAAGGALFALLLSCCCCWWFALCCFKRRKKKDKKAEEEVKKKDSASSEGSQGSFQDELDPATSKNYKSSRSISQEGLLSSGSISAPTHDTATDSSAADAKNYKSNRSISQEGSLSSTSITAPTHNTATDSSAADSKADTLFFLRKQKDQRQSSNSGAANAESPPLVHFGRPENEEHSDGQLSPPPIKTLQSDSDSDQAEVLSEHVPANTALSASVPLPARLSDTNVASQLPALSQSINCTPSRFSQLNGGSPLTPKSRFDAAHGSQSRQSKSGALPDQFGEIHGEPQKMRSERMSFGICTLHTANFRSERQPSPSTNHLCVSARDIAIKVAESHKNEMAKHKDGADAGSPRPGHTSLVVDADMEALRQGSMSLRQGSVTGSLFASPIGGALLARRMNSVSSSSVPLSDSFSALSPPYSRVSSPVYKSRASAWMEPPPSPIDRGRAAAWMESPPSPLPVRGVPPSVPETQASNSGLADTQATTLWATPSLRRNEGLLLVM